MGWEFQIMIIILHHNHNHVICSYFQKILLITGYAFEDKKIGWEEFQIMINPPPPPKAPTPHKVTELGVQLYLQGRSLSITNDL